MRRIVVLAALLACKPSPAAAPSPPAAPATPAAASPSVAAAPAPHAPAGDLDRDGVPDSSDRCPDEPEDLDQFEDQDGCVDRDNDGDGVLDAHEFLSGRWTNCDRRIENGVDLDCRNRPEDMDGVEDWDGCPDVLCLDNCQLKLADHLHFDRRGRFAPDTDARLDEVAATLHAAPAISIFIDAHLDAQRDDTAARKLTQRLADETVAALVRRGVARERLLPRGFGDLVPRADNRDAAGRAANRRVEFNLGHCGCGPLPPGLRAAAGLPPPIVAAGDASTCATGR